jgi:hypothetical protein
VLGQVNEVFRVSLMALTLSFTICLIDVQMIFLMQSSFFLRLLGQYIMSDFLSYSFLSWLKNVNAEFPDQIFIFGKTLFASANERPVYFSGANLSGANL